MDIKANEFRVKKCLLVWPIPIQNRVQALFTMVFMNILEMDQYTCRVLTKTDTFHLIIPLDRFENLSDDPVYKFPQVVRIDVICDSINDVKWAKRCFPSACTKVHFCTIYDLLGSLVDAELDNALTSLDSIGGSMISDIISLIEARIPAKRSNISIRRSRIRKQFASTLLYGYPVRNILDFAPHFTCPSCKLVYQQAYQLECKHQQCQICVNIQRCCATCFNAVVRDKVVLNESLQIAMENLSTHCSVCEQTQLWKDYEIHLKQNHNEIITCFIHNQQVNESIFHQQYLTEVNQGNFIGNLSSPNLNITGTSLNGTCIWEISDIENIKNDAILNEPKSIYSAPFYIFPNGYKMQLQLFLNGNNDTLGTYLSLFLIIMRGDFDETLLWPFKCKVTFTLLNQLQPNDSYSNSFWSNTRSICFQRPNTDMNLAYGFSKFFSLDRLKHNENDFIQDDTMFIKIHVDLLIDIPEIPWNDDASELKSDEVDNDTTEDDDISAMICCSDSSSDAQ